MSQATNRSETVSADATHGSTRGGNKSLLPFAGLIEPVIVEEAIGPALSGCVPRKIAQASWIWVYRDLCPDLIRREAIEAGTFAAADIEPLMPQILGRMKDALARASKDAEEARRLRAMLGGDEERAALPAVLNALRGRALLGKAQTFGRALNNMTDDAALTVALQSMPLQDPPLASLLFHAAMGHVANPTRLVTTVIKLAGSGSEAAVARIGFSPLVEAILGHAQNQIHLMRPTSGTFADYDLICRALDRFHRLVRSLTGYIEFTRGSLWASIISATTKQASDIVEPRLRDVVPNINLALRRAREGTADRLDSDRMLAAINGVYLLSTVRACRDSLALNATFDQVWSQSAETLEHYLQRNLDLLRENPTDAIVGARLDGGIKMAEIRFNPEYADTLRRARSAAERRV
jgi:hypothetical protein